MGRAAGDTFGLDEVREHVHGLKGGDVAGRAGVPDGVPLVVELVLGEEDGEFDLAGPGPAVLALALASGGLGAARMQTPVPSTAP